MKQNEQARALYELRLEKKVTFEQWAAAVGLSAVFLSALVRGKTTCTREVFDHLRHSLIVLGNWQEEISKQQSDLNATLRLKQHPAGNIFLR